MLTKDRLLAVLWNLCFTAGAGVFSFGMWLAWRPLGWIVLGLLLAVLGYGGGFEQARKGRRR